MICVRIYVVKGESTDETVENDLVQQIVDGIKGEIPEAMFENRLNQCVDVFYFMPVDRVRNLRSGFVIILCGKGLHLIQL